MGDLFQKVKNRLIELGYCQKQDNCDLVRIKLKNFQRACGLSSTGEPDVDTLIMLNMEDEIL